MATKLTRVEQDDILRAVIAGTSPQACPHAPRTTVPILRAALRLDDPVLGKLIESEAYKMPWQSTAPSHS